MERLQQKINVANKALLALNEVLQKKVDPIIRDAAIQRFEFTVETVWKAIQLYLKIKEGLDLASPKQVMRTCFSLGLLNEAQTSVALEMIDDRNLTSHTYDEATAERIFSHLRKYEQIMQELLDYIKKYE